MTIVIISLVVFVLGLQVGYFSKELITILRRFLAIIKPKQGSAVVGGAYKPKSSYTTSSSIVEPKSPARLEYEVSEALKKQAGL